ncbi:M13 family metallopeptidase [Paucibacter sp. B2R-40]|uniref:M13 family metallopeptidase n=1 Tax=Paucibacter sp. B2R-40 TaxID=2893554 RepID=UPI0021E44FD3|nr:M13 family metallopeptidase [Paucibacter sp. B2R-40]MCV2353330.1 M13 family metallopeptidase [Paucibacter sp. B2R-40]
MKPSTALKLSCLALLTQFAAFATPSWAGQTQSGLDLPGFDQAVRAQDDLYRHSSGSWLKSGSIPADKAEVYGADMPAVVDQRIRRILQELASKPQAKGSNAKKIGDYHAAYLDTVAIDKAGLAPIKPLLAEIAALKTAQQLAAWAGRAQGQIETPIWLWGGFADFMNPGLNRVMAWQGGLGLPDRDFYLKLDDAQFTTARTAYLAYLTELARLAGLSKPADLALRVLSLETRLAQAHTPLSEARNPAKMYNPLSAEELIAQAPGFDWQSFLAAAKISGEDKVTVTQLDTAIATARLFAELPLADWQAYFTLRSLDAAAQVLPAGFRAAHFAFHGKAITGAQLDRPRAKRALEQVSEALNDALAEQYVARHFSPAHKQRVETIFQSVLAAYQQLMAANSWMEPATKAAALDKLSKYKAKIGHPDSWRDYGALEVRAGDAFGNQQRAKCFAWEHKAAAAGKAMDRKAWAMSPLEVNAFYDPMGNEINMTAGILQAPLFEMQADDAANYGGIGATIGHEISHGFDNMGAQFDGDGVMRPWWTEADRKAFEALGARLVTQFNALEALPGKTVNGELTLPENIADLVGVQIAFKAYQASLGGRAAPVIDRYSGEQRFFLSFAQSWRVKRRDKRTLQLLSSDPHAPNEFRANASAQNVDGFHEAFGTQAGDKMFKPAAARVRLW